MRSWVDELQKKKKKKKKFLNKYIDSRDVTWSLNDVKINHGSLY